MSGSFLSSETAFILAQIVGGFVVLLAIVHAFQKDRKYILVCNALSNALCVLQYLLLGAYTGIICCVIAILRNVVFSRYKNKVPFGIFLIFATVLVVSNIPFVHHFYDVLPVLNVLIYSAAICQSKVHKIKGALIFTGISGIIYDIFEHAYVGLLLNAVDLLGGLAGVYRYRKEQRMLKEQKRLKARKKSTKKSTAKKPTPKKRKK
ncbi:MAG: YgjV family protein [Candidatus Saccharibacteria bacterium]|nr:YgjV family protein [Candidatus Saccharibacteria bacterium]